MHAPRKNDSEYSLQTPICLESWVCVKIPDTSVLPACLCPQEVRSLTDQKKHVSALYPHCCSLSYPGMRNCPGGVGRRDPSCVPASAPQMRAWGLRGALCCTAWAACLFPGRESHPGLQKPSTVPPLQHRNTWKGLNLVLNVMRLCKSQGCNTVQKQTENMACFQPSESGWAFFIYFFSCTCERTHVTSCRRLLALSARMGSHSSCCKGFTNQQSCY